MSSKLLSNETRDWLLSMPQSELEVVLMRYQPVTRSDILKQLMEHRTSTERATESLYEFVKQAWPIIEPAPFVDNWHIGAMCEHLQAVTDGEIMKLLFNIPPGCSKSLLVAVFWFCWEWAVNPATRFMYVSYDQPLSTRDSVKCRALIESQWYRSQWPHVQFKSDQNQKTYYESTAGGFRLASTPAGRGTGEHPDRIVVDDPHKVKQAESEKERQAVIDWWDLTMPTRGLSRGARRVGVMQRLHEKDWSGHVLAEGDWVHICLPMYFEPDRMKTTPLGFNDPRTDEGELLTPMFTEEKLEAAKKTLGPYGIAGQFQQRPAPREGGMFKWNWFELVPQEAVPRSFDRMARGWDLAATEGDGDNSATVLIGVKGDRLWILHAACGQWGAGERDDRIDLMAMDDSLTYGTKVKTWFPQDPAAAGKQVAQILAKRLTSSGHRVGYELMTGSKVDRADALASRCWSDEKRGERVCVVQAGWTQQFLAELTTFPNSAHDDQVDAVSLAYNKLMTAKTMLVGNG